MDLVSLLVTLLVAFLVAFVVKFIVEALGGAQYSVPAAIVTFILVVLVRLGSL